MDEGIYSSKIFDEAMLLEFIHDNITSNFSQLDMQIILKYLSRDTGDCTYKSTAEGNVVIKFGDSEITSEDVDIAHVRLNIHEISKRMTAIESKIKVMSQSV